MDAGSLPLAELVRRCRETNSEQDTCRYELFRRAIYESDEQAWAAVTVLFRGVVVANIRRHPWAASRDDEEYWINRTFERFWKALGPDRFAAFPHLPALLAYLKTCVHSVVVTDMRSSARTPAVVPLGTDVEEPGASTEIEGEVLDSLVAQDVWNVITAELADDDERLLARLSFALDMKPAQIQALHADRFPTMAELYRVKRNLIERLRRSSRLRELLK